MIPILFVLIAIYLVIGPIIESPQIELLYAFLFIIGGLLFYFPFVYFKLKIKGFGKIPVDVLCTKSYIWCISGALIVYIKYISVDHEHLILICNISISPSEQKYTIILDKNNYYCNRTFFKLCKKVSHYPCFDFSDVVKIIF